MLRLRPLGRIKRTIARLQLWTIRRPFSAGTAASAVVSSIAALGNYYLGFRPTRIKSGSPAALWQSRMGHVERGSAFSALQSAGAGGSGALTVYGTSAAGAALLTVVLGYRLRSRATMRRLILKRQTGIDHQKTLTQVKIPEDQPRSV